MFMRLLLSLLLALPMLRAAAKLPGPAAPERSVAEATIVPMIAIPIAEPKLRKVWVTPEAWPRISSGTRLSTARSRQTR